MKSRLLNNRFTFLKWKTDENTCRQRKRITRKASSLARQYKFLIYWALHFPLLREASSRSLTWVISKCLAPLHLTTSTVVPGQTCPYLAQGLRASSSEAGQQTSESLRCHHFVTCCSHPSRGWSCWLWLNMHDHEGDSTASLEKS